MKIGFFGRNEGMGYLFKEIPEKLMSRKDISFFLDKACLCEAEHRRDFDIAIVHPDPNNNFKCWDKIKELIYDAPKKQFYLIAILAKEREGFFGDSPNLKYINEGNQEDIISDILSFKCG